ncbi:MAG: aminotransferase class III-fold pyridoxal phosphate-dependent enzyme, partial [Kordiimonadaceae bacterium]|nr:aminotransferase class III-fold pyridoxal phosphate-dependent enzyme [Kordiimonadaceae bacterium]
TVAAFIAEPIVGASLGAVTAATGYFTRIREICDTYEVLLIADEVMCGTGRTGTFFAHQQEGFLPDIVTLAKGLGGGYLPLAATIARQKIIEPFEQAGHGFSHGHTYVGHASSCAVGVAVLETIESEQLLGAVHRQGAHLEAALTQAFTHHPNIGDIRGRGLFRALEIVSDKNSKTVPKEAPLLAKRIRENAMKQGLMCYPSGSVDNCHILLAPPFILADQHIDQMVDRLKPALEEALNA